MGNYTSTENTKENIESGVDTRPIDKEAQQKIVEELEKMLTKSLNSPTSENSDEESVQDDPVQDDPAQDDSDSESESEDTELRRVVIDKAAILKALLEVEKQNADIALAEYNNELSEIREAHRADTVVLRSINIQRQNEITELKNQIIELEKSVQKWRNFYFDASFTNSDCKNCKKPTFTFGETQAVPSLRLRPRPRPRPRRSGLRVKTNFGSQENIIKPKQIFNINANGRAFDTQTQGDWSQSDWGNKNTWSWNANNFDKNENNSIDWGKFSFPKSHF
jgi:hypothetical protein